MIWLALVAALVLAASLVGAVFARLRLWGARLRAPEPSAQSPAGPLIFAAASERGRFAELVPVLADWVLRGVLVVERIGPNLPVSRATGASMGPVWRFTAGPSVAQVDPIELVVLGAMFSGTPRTGQVVTLEREDVAWREAVSSSIQHAITLQRQRFGTEPPRMHWLRPLLLAVAILAGVVLIVAAAIGGVGLAALAWLSVGVPVAVTVVGLFALWPAKSSAERDYLQATRDFGAWVRSTDAPVRELGGWAMIWDLPGPWPGVVPPEVSGMLHLDHSFLRGDFHRTIPEVNTYY